MIRVFFATIFSLLITFLLFFAMQKIIFNTNTSKESSERFEYIDFIRIKPKVAEVKKEKKKKIEKKQKTLPKRVVLTSQRQNIKTKMPKIDIQPIDIPRNFKNTISLNDIAVQQDKPIKTSLTPQYSTDILPIFTIPPNYPRLAKRRNIQGYIILNFTIDKKGNVKNIEVKEAKPQGYFERAAKEAISKWKFKPKYNGENAIEQLAQQRLEFTLR